MASFLLKHNAHSSLAQSFYHDVLSKRNMYYYFLGKTNPWNPTDIPPDVFDTHLEESMIRNHIIHMKRININDVCFVAPRYNWASGTIYDRYDADITPAMPSSTGATSIQSAKFYVLTDEMNVYKCIHNNWGTPSTSKPMGSDYGIMEMPDGYIWKYLFTISPNLQYKFLSDTHIPVANALNRRYYDNQGIESVTIHSGGSGYEGSPITTAIVHGDGSGATIRLSMNPIDGSIDKVKVLTQGSGYTQSTIEVIAADGHGTGKYGNTTAILTPVIYDGKLMSVNIIDPGKEYSTNSQVNLIVAGTGKDAELWPVVENGQIVDVVIQNPGYGYSEATITVAGVVGSGASISVSTGIGDVDTIQADVELLAVPGAVYVADVTNEGTGYTYATCTVYGDGYGLQITPVVHGGKVVRLTIDSPGTNYTYADLVITGNGTGATGRAIYSPAYGHGHDAVRELMVDTVSIHAPIRFEKTQGLYINNDYRQFGIIKNPTTSDTQTIYRDLNGSSCFLLSIPNAAAINTDDEFSLQNDTTKKFIAVASNGTQVMIQDLGGVRLVAGNVLVRNSDGHQFSINAVEYPQVDKKSGDMIFVDNRVAVYQTSDQFISLRTIIKF